ncbi:type IV toxin-antitoxin system AbiEi family antitoxin [Massilia sp. TWP1-3-3]|uniref:type IV toxin-antitoxin system AbiEi family antitoxin n=1 Tax=Massilia sp. TWP1-3-3 TaxID=2804573 RepID=UPI003CF19C7E
MNKRTNAGLMLEAQLIGEALNSLKETTGISSELLAGDEDQAGSVSLLVAGTRLDYVCEVRRNVDRIAILNDMKARCAAGKKRLLVSSLLTNAMATRCRELDIEFIDTAGNALITNGDGILISITGYKIEKGSTLTSDKTITPAALRLMFAALAQPSILNASYREISSSVRVATGAIGTALQTLEARGFIGTTPTGRRIINAPELMLSEWATGYISRLRPKLKKFRFATANPTEVMQQWSPEMRVSALGGERANMAWGGEVAAEKITQHLNPSTFTIYMEFNDTRDLTELVKRFKLRADPQGTIEVIQAFWNMDYFFESFPTVPLHLIYADLLATNDSRNLLIARKIYQEVINYVHGTED